MTYLSKKHNKFVAAAATATLVATAVTPAALAATATKDFSDVANHWGKEAIDYLVNKGVLDGYPNGTFQPDGDITRAEVAKVLAVTLELDVDIDVKASFADADDHWASAYIAAIEGQLEGVINGFEDGTFRPDQNISRQDMAKMIVAAYDLTGNDAVDVNFNDKASYAEAQEAIEILASLGVVQGQSAGVFAPAAEVTRAETATFVLRAEVPAKRVAPVQTELAITNVTSLTEDGHVLKVEFSRPMASFDKHDVALQEKASKSRVGIESVELAADGMSAEIIAYDNTAESAPYEVKRGVEYSLTINTLTFDFTRPYYLDDRSDARVTEIDAEDKDFTVSYVSNGEGKTATIKVPDGAKFDYEAAIGMEIRVWFDGDNKLVNYEIVDESKVLFDAFELNADNEIELQTADKEIELANNPVVYVDGKIASVVPEKAEYAKIILDDKGDVAYIYAYDFEDLTVVESVEGTIVEGLGDEDLDLEDFVIVKDGKTIQVSDLEAGDAIHYTEAADNSLGEKGYAVVYNNVISGDIETIYDESFVVDGKKYDYGFDYINVDGDLKNDFQKNEAEDFEGEEVTIYVDYNGDVQLLTGVQGEAGNDVLALLTDDALVWEDNKDNVAIELDYVNEDGEEEAKDISFENLDSITVDGFKYDIEQDKDENKDYIITKGTGDNQFVINTNDEADAEKDADDVQKAVTLNDNTSFILTFDNNGEVTDLEIFDTFVDDLKVDKDIEPGDKYAELDSKGDKRLQNDTVVFVAEEEGQTDAEDIQVYRFADIDFDIDSETAKVYYNEDGDVESIVVADTVASNTTDVIAVVDSFATTDDEVTRLVAYVNGEKKTYTVDKVELEIPEAELGNYDKVKDYLDVVLAEGQAVKLEVNDETGEVEEILLAGDDKFTQAYFELNQTGATAITSSKFMLGTTEYKKGDNFQIVDATDRDDLETKTSLSSIKGKKFHVVLEAAGSRYVETIIIVGDEDQPNDRNYDGVFAITNNAPTVANALKDVTGVVVGDEKTYSVANVFADEDEDALSYTVTSANPAIASVTPKADTITLTAVAAGTVDITVTANDGNGGVISDTFAVTIVEGSSN